MKLAILGSGASALEASVYYYALGAHVTCFTQENQGGSLRQLMEFSPERILSESWEEVTSSWGRDFVEFNNSIDIDVTYQNYFSLYLDPMINKLKKLGVLKTSPVSRVHKRFLSRDETPANRSRIADLFRVVWTLNPESAVREMMGENKLYFEAMGSEVMKSLSAPIESFADFDLVIDATGVLHRPRPMGPSASLAINELQIARAPKVLYSLKALKFWPDIESSKNIIVVGSGRVAAFLVVQLRSWLERSDQHRISLVTTEGQAFKKFLEEAHQLGGWEERLAKELLDLLVSVDDEYQKKCDTYASKLHDWRGLEAHEKIKKPAPSAPVSKLELIHHSNVTSLDQLSDREGIFVTCERSELRAGQEELSTINADRILVATGHCAEPEFAKSLLTEYSKDKKGALSSCGTHPEPGFYTLGQAYRLKDIFGQIKEIEADMMRFFSKS